MTDCIEMYCIVYYGCSYLFCMKNCHYSVMWQLLYVPYEWHV